MSDKSFVGTYFEGKTGDKLRSTITPSWNEKNLNYHLELVGCPKDAKAVCEIGSGIGRLLKPIYDSGVSHCVGFDASQSMVEEGEKYVGDRNVQIFKVDGNGGIDIGASEYFDFVFSIITFQHIPNTETVKKYLSEAHRLLKDGSELMFQVLSKDMNRGELWSYHPLEELESHLKDLGFKDIKIEHKDKWAVFRCEKSSQNVQEASK